MTPTVLNCPNCGKACHRSRKIARTKAAQSRRINGYPLYTYKCLACHHWHLTHLNPKGITK